MGRGVANSKLTKDMILSKVSQQLIAATYLDIPIETVDWCIETGKTISSPLREDNHPSFGFAFNNRGQLKAKDFAGYFWGDVWDIIAYVLSAVVERDIDVANKHDFIFCLKHCAYTFRNYIYGKEKDERINADIRKGLVNIKSRKNIIEIVPRGWNNNDKEYWKQFGINLNFLNTHYIYAVDQYYINRKINPEPKYYYNPHDPCYAYLLGQDSKGIYNWKLYFPKRSHNEVRFITNSNHIEGVLNLDGFDYDFIIITKSTKDRLALEQFCYDYPLRGDNHECYRIGVINIPHETHELTQTEYNFIRSKCARNGKIISLFDNDRTGYMCAIKYRDKWNIPPCIIPHEYGAKDFAELRSLYSPNTIVHYINETIKLFNNRDEEIETIGYQTEMPY